MPTYDYECRFCEHRFEHFQGLSDAKLRKCPSCGRNGLDRLFGTGAGVVFKGSGFYETDYKRAGASKRGGGDASTGGDGAKASDKGSEKGSGKGASGKQGGGDGAPAAKKPAGKPDKSDS